MQLYGLKQLRVVREEKLDTKCFLAWNEDILVLAFRGTASTRNAISDLQVCFPSTMLQPPTLVSSVSVCLRCMQKCRHSARHKCHAFVERPSGMPSATCQKLLKQSASW